jgi:hypothetical protein
MAAEGSATDRLLILACSQRKRPDAELLPALERYDGPAFRVLRRFLRSRAPDPPEVLILSAEHGLIPRDLPIAAYDRKMTPARARGKVRRCYVQFPVFEEPAETVMSVVESLAHQLSNTQKEMFPDIFKAAKAFLNVTQQELLERQGWLSDYLSNESIDKYGIRSNLYFLADFTEALVRAGRNEESAG